MAERTLTITVNDPGDLDAAAEYAGYPGPEEWLLGMLRAGYASAVRNQQMDVVHAQQQQQVEDVNAAVQAKVDALEPAREDVADVRARGGRRGHA